jgi:hypothetical protein
LFGAARLRYGAHGSWQQYERRGATLEASERRVAAAERAAGEAQRAAAAANQRGAEAQQR